MSVFNLRVSIADTTVGHLLRNRSGLVTFVPEQPWLDLGQYPRLGWSFLLEASTRAGTGLPVWFEHLLPELGSLPRKRVCRAHGIDVNDSPGLLRLLGQDLPGAVQVEGHVDGSESHATAFDANGLHFSSLAGMQLKWSMVLSGTKFVFPARDELGHWIIKIPGVGTPELVEVEVATMSWAAATGIEVPQNHAVKIDDINGIEPGDLELSPTAFAIRRFDRDEGRRVHQEDFAQVFGIHDKYCESGKKRTNYDGISRLVRDACGKSEQERFVDQLAFMIASGNSDCHLKNWSFQWLTERPKPRLSPAYDLVSTISWAEFGWAERTHDPVVRSSTQRWRGPDLALTFGKVKLFKNLDHVALNRFAERSEMPEAVNRVLQTLRRARATWHAQKNSAPKRMQAAIAEHWQRVPLLRDLEN